MRVEPAPIASPGLPEKGPGAPPPRPREPVTPGEMRATLALFVVFVVNILLAAWFSAPFRKAGLQAFENPEDTANAIWYVAIILAFTFLILWIAKRGKKAVIRWVILVAVGSTITYVMYGILDMAFPTAPYVAALGMKGLPLAIAATIGFLGVVLLYKHPEWWVIDAVGILVASGSAAIFGISFGILPVIVLLALLAVYDAIAVYRTKHMLSLADTVIDLRLPVLLVIPKHRGYRFREQAAKFKEASQENKGERDAMFMGLGDLVMPTILVVSALTFLPWLTAMPLVAEAETDGPVGLPFDVHAASTAGHPVQVTYHVSSPAPGSAEWDWTMTWADGHTERGDRLPGMVTRTFDSPTFIVANVTVTDAGGQAGSMDLYTEASHADKSLTSAFSALAHNPPALGAAVGTLAGFLALMFFVLRGNPQAGLPLLNGGAITGFLVGLYLATGSFRFW